MGLEAELKRIREPQKAKILSKFFKTGSGEYGEGDIFWGISVPDIRNIASRYADSSLDGLLKILSHPVHEVRLAVLLALVAKYESGTETERREVVSAYLNNTKYINNWDLVDLSCYKILGDYLLCHPKEQKLLLRLAASPLLWEKRIAMVSTMAFIREGELDWTFRLAKTFFKEKHDLMHKATGWLLREAGKKDEKRLKEFLDRFGSAMPRVALRYAIERLSDKDKKRYLNGTKNGENK